MMFTIVLRVEDGRSLKDILSKMYNFLLNINAGVLLAFKDIHNSLLPMRRTQFRFKFQQWLALSIEASKIEGIVT